jgi:hypothetical protein
LLGEAVRSLFITVQIIAYPPPLSFSQVGQDAMLRQFLTAFGLCGGDILPLVAGVIYTVEKKSTV